MATPREQLAPRKQTSEVVVQGPRVVVRAPPVKIPKIELPTINVPPIDLGPVVRTLNGLIGAVSDLRGVVAGQQKTIAALVKQSANITVTAPPRARTYEVEIDDGDGGTRVLRVRAGK